MVKIIVNGAAGKMGQRIIALAKQAGADVVCGLESTDHPKINQDVEGVKVVSDYSQIANCDCVIDFSAPAATVNLLPEVIKHKKSIVIGTTGLDQAQQEKIKEASKEIPVVFSPNMSIGVNVLFKLVKEASAILKGYNIYLEEAHHIHKKDAPSGTAKKIVEIINSEGFSVKNEEVKAIREDEIVGDHKIVFESDVDKVELFHSAKTRDIFAQGAVVAAGWIVGKPVGLYSMDEVLFSK